MVVNYLMHKFYFLQFFTTLDLGATKLKRHRLDECKGKSLVLLAIWDTTYDLFFSIKINPPLVNYLKCHFRHVLLK